MTKITAVAAPSITHTEHVDYTFLFYAGPNTYGNPWGTLVCVDGAGRVNTFKGVQEGDWSSPDYRWELNIFQSGHGTIMGGSIDFTEDGNSLIDFLKDAVESLEEFTLLISHATEPYLHAACEALGVELVVHTVKVPLAMSGNECHSRSNQHAPSA